jgi:pyridoxal phosphate enzyme (YggS family)
MSAFEDRWLVVRERIAAAASRSGRNAQEIELVAVSKGHPPEAIAEAVAAGQTLFGESRVQEARVKIAEAAGATRWHFIGHLQKNKVRQALPLFELVESIDSLDLAQAVDRIAGEDGFRPRVLLEVNVAGEGSKHGFSPEALRQALEQLLALPRLQIEGLMAIPPAASDAEDSRPYFVQLRTLRDAIESEFDVRLPALSMGMSGDYAVAVEEGATLVRVGTALFGGRRK